VLLQLNDAADNGSSFASARDQPRSTILTTRRNRRGPHDVRLVEWGVLIAVVLGHRPGMRTIHARLQRKSEHQGSIQIGQYKAVGRLVPVVPGKLKQEAEAIAIRPPRFADLSCADESAAPERTPRRVWRTGLREIGMSSLAVSAIEAAEPLRCFAHNAGVAEMYQ
jgi:hypothetical protein